MSGMENWRPIIGFEGTYEVSDHGRVRRSAPGPGTSAGRIRKLVPRNGYTQIVLSKSNRQTLHWVHRLVASTFVPNPLGRREVNHKDGNRSNNAVQNLEWVSHSENESHAYRNGFRIAAPLYGEANGFAKLTEKAVREMRRLRPQLPLRELAKKYSVSISSVSAICRRECWKHVV
jgi:hypothetical protein